MVLKPEGLSQDIVYIQDTILNQKRWWNGKTYRVYYSLEGYWFIENPAILAGYTSSVQTNSNQPQSGIFESTDETGAVRIDFECIGNVLFLFTNYFYMAF